MSNSTTLLDTISSTQSAKETTANELFDAHSPASLFGRRALTTTGLTWGYYGGMMLVDGVLTSISNGTVALSASSTNYVEATRAGVVSKNTTGFTAGQIPLYTIVTGTATVTSYTDERATWDPRYMAHKVSVSITSADVTLSAAQARARHIVLTGTLTGNRNLIVPDSGEWLVYNNTSGSYTVTVKTSGGTGETVDQGSNRGFFADGTNVVATTTGGGVATSLDDLTDVDTTGAISGDALVFDGSFWVPVAGGGGAVSLDSTVTDIFSIASDIISADDPGADRILFWDDSAGKLTYLAVGTNLSISGTTLNATGGGGSGITLGTPQATTSGSNIDFTGIPNTVKRITVMLNGVSLSGTDQVLIQLGTSSGVETTGYVARAGDQNAANSSTSGFNTYYAGATDARIGTYIFSLMDTSSNTWVGGGNISLTNSTNSAATASGIKSLGGVLDRIRLTVSGSNTFDAGSVNISYE
jgi:hypothetical protein